MDRSEVAGICFDLGGTVVDDHGMPATLELAELLGVDLPTMRAYLRPSKCVREAIADLAHRLALQFGRPDVTESLIDVLVRRRSSVAKPRLFEDARGAISQLRERGYKTAFLSNILGAIAPSYRDGPLSALADVTLLSCDIGHAKPERQAFTAVEHALALTPEQLVHVGDAYTADTQGALQAGWQAVHIDRTTPGAATQSRAGGKAMVIGELRTLLQIFPARERLADPGRRLI